MKCLIELVISENDWNSQVFHEMPHYTFACNIHKASGPLYKYNILIAAYTHHLLYKEKFCQKKMGTEQT